MASRALATKFPAQLKELRLHLCQTSAASQGVSFNWDDTLQLTTQADPLHTLFCPPNFGNVQFVLWHLDFIENSYVPLKQTNPKFPILIRECSEVVPRAWARYELGREASVSLEGLTQDQVQTAIVKLATSA